MILCCVYNGLYIYLPVQFHKNWPHISVNTFVFLTKALADAGRFKGNTIWEYKIKLPRAVSNYLSCGEWNWSNLQGATLWYMHYKDMRWAPLFSAASPGWVHSEMERALFGVGSLAAGHVCGFLANSLGLILVSILSLSNCGSWILDPGHSPGILVIIFIFIEVIFT